jgi:hypothetical protein
MHGRRTRDRMTEAERKEIIAQLQTQFIELHEELYEKNTDLRQKIQMVVL